MSDDPSKIARQVDQQARVTAAYEGGGTMLTEPILVINQKAKLIDIVSEYKVFLPSGQQIGAVRQEGGKKWLRLVVNKALLPANVAIIDVSGQPVLRVDKQFSWMRPKVFLQDGSGNVVGQFEWAKLIGKPVINFMVNGQKVGAIKTQNWRAWNFSIEDASGVEVGTISKTWAGLGKEMFTNADNYVLSLNRKLDNPLAWFTVAASLCIDTVLKQNSR